VAGDASRARPSALHADDDARLIVHLPLLKWEDVPEDDDDDNESWDYRFLPRLGRRYRALAGGSASGAAP
jgi:hypothetical protein